MGLVITCSVGRATTLLNGKAGNDVLFGEAGADVFVFEHGTGGDVIGDFVAGTDRIDLSAIGFANFQAVVNAMHEVNGTTAIDLGAGDLIVLNGVAMSSLHAADFILTGAAAPASDALGVEGFAVGLDILAIQDGSMPDIAGNAQPGLFRPVWALDVANDNGRLDMPWHELPPIGIDTAVA